MESLKHSAYLLAFFFFVKSQLSFLDFHNLTTFFQECAQTTTGANKQICVEQLIPRHRYRFRVRAANKIGPSEATEMTGPDILAKDPWGKNHF